MAVKSHRLRWNSSTPEGQFAQSHSRSGSLFDLRALSNTFMTWCNVRPRVISGLPGASYQMYTSTDSAPEIPEQVEPFFVARA